MHHRPHQPELDWLKGIMIILMVVFHLGYIGDLYPAAKAFVYTFHMPTFLLISGYLLNTTRPIEAFGRKILWIIIPYMALESAYVAASAVLPVRESVDKFSLLLLLDKNLLHPLGPYWYLHTLILCSITCYVVEHLPLRWRIFGPGSRLIVSGVLLYALSCSGLVNEANAFWFLAGAAIRIGGLRLTNVFFPSWFSIIPICFIALHHEWFDRASLPGILLAGSMISWLTALWRQYGDLKVFQAISYLGRNTLVIFLFSPIFTMAMKQFLPLFQADRSGLSYLLCATTTAILGSLGLGLASDRTGFSRFLFGRSSVMNK